MLRGFPGSETPQHVIFKGSHQRRVRAARQRMANHLRHPAQRVVAVFRQAARVIPLARQAACGVILKPASSRGSGSPASSGGRSGRSAGASGGLPGRRRSPPGRARCASPYARAARRRPARTAARRCHIRSASRGRPPAASAQTPCRSQRPAVGVAFGVTGAQRSPRRVIKPLALVAGAVLVAHQLPALVPPEPVRVVQRVGLLNQVALLNPLKASRRLSGR